MLNRIYVIYLNEYKVLLSKKCIETINKYTSLHQLTCDKRAPVRHLQNDERLHVPNTRYLTLTRANLHPVRNPEIICAKPSMCFFKTKKRENCTNL